MRTTLQVKRRPESFGPMQIGERARRVLQLARRISDIRLERQFVDEAVLSFEVGDQLSTYVEIDLLLAETGLQRV